MVSAYSTQQFVCMTSTFFLWFVTVLAVAIDNGLAFITVMAFVGWIRGYKTQGVSRSLVHLTQGDLFKKIGKRCNHDPCLASTQFIFSNCSFV